MVLLFRVIYLHELYGGVMNYTEHAMKRMNQRGISQLMVQLVEQFGEFLPGEKIVLNQKRAREIAAVLHKLIDKGGLTIVADNNCVLTTHNCNKKKKRK